MSTAPSTTSRPSRRTIAWTIALALLVALRAPSIAQPLGGDQGLYLHAGQRVLEGGVPYRDAWDQKPPGVFFVYASLWRVWPDEAVIGLADLVAAALVAALLVRLGGRAWHPAAGFAAAALFLLLGHPSIGRLGGVFVRSQCETFIALAIAASIALAWRPDASRGRLALAGVWLGLAGWLKYNAVLYALPVAIAVLLAPAAGPADSWRARARRLGPVGLGAALAATIGLLYFASGGALDDLWLATVEYNLRYSGETYDGPGSVLRYLAVLPVERARYDLLWFLGGLGALALLPRVRRDRGAAVALAWVAAAVLSIAANGARSLPQYFVQAQPALAFAAAGGAAALASRGRALRVAAVLFVLAGLWRVGVDAPVLGVRLGGLPGLAGNVRFDLAYLSGRIARPDYLARFRAEEKYDALEVDALAARVRATTAPTDAILVFGFSPGVYVKSGRPAASRFFWSRPVVIGFAADRPGYGADGLLADLERTRPAIVALQTRDWGPGEPDSSEYFLAHPALGAWLRAGYALEADTGLFLVWRRRPA